MSARRKTAAAAEPADIGARILHHCAGASSKQPARADDVAALVRGDRPAFASALERLTASRQLATAHIQRRGDPAPWLAIWPTGVTPRGEMWTSASHNTLFVHEHLPSRLPQGPDPDRDPRPDLGYASRTKGKTTGASQPMPTVEQSNRLREQAASMIEGRAKTDAVPIKHIAEALGISQRGALGVCERLEKRGEAKRMVDGVGNTRCAKAYDPRVAVAPAAAADAAGAHATMAAEVGRQLAAAIGAEPATAPAAPATAPAAPATTDHEPRKRGELIGAAWSVLQGLPASRALSLAELGGALAVGGTEPSHAALTHVLDLLQADGRVLTTARQRPDGHRGPRVITAWYDAAAGEPAHGQCADATAEEMTARQLLVDMPPDNDPADPVRFCLFDNGELAVVAGPRFLVVPPAATRRLAALLGVNGGAQ